MALPVLKGDNSKHGPSSMNEGTRLFTENRDSSDSLARCADEPNAASALSGANGTYATGRTKLSPASARQASDREQQEQEKGI